jgi:hypothetical protein
MEEKFARLLICKREACRSQNAGIAKRRSLEFDGGTREKLWIFGDEELGFSRASPGRDRGDRGIR